ncbi:glutamate receptor ionotropic, kainate 2 [Cryptotermes secundus]|uniref:glutamate receptor ionotropic, kainate 2 n=1 Tax=Cryptotermes secundus TaxID=105785 RepID=UPI000CD7C210|nr:glutamate receptor ionotropic, kainate 2 [Cryptotermes secundus]
MAPVFFMCIMFSASSDTTPQTMASRIVYFTMHLTAVILFVAYSATFISFLAVRRHDLPFTDFTGLLKDGTYRLGVLSGSARVDFFKKSKISALNEIYRKLIHPDVTNLPNSDSEGLQRICRNEKYSYVISQTTLRGLARSIPCSIVGVPQAYYTVAATMIISKSSPYKRILNYHVQEIKRTGILTRIEANAWPPKYSEILEEPPSSVNLGTVTVFFVILLMAVIASVFVLAVEFGIRILGQSY